MSSPDRTLHEIFQNEWNYTLEEHPEMATVVGCEGDTGRWTDYSPEAIERREAHARALKETLDEIERESLSEADRLNLDLFRLKVEEEVESQRFHDDWMPLNLLMGAHLDAGRVIGMMPGFSVDDYEAILSRMEGLPALIDQTMALMRKGLEQGITPAGVTLAGVPGQVEGQIQSEPEGNPFLIPFASIPEHLGNAVRERLSSRAREIYDSQVRPSFERLHTFLTETYLPGCRTTLGMSELPDGVAWYEFRARHWTTSRLSVEKLHETGLSEVARIRAEMDRVIGESGFDGGFEEFTHFLLTDPQFFHETPESLLREYRDIAKRIDPGMMKLFGKLPRLPYGIIPIPEHAAPAMPTAYYQPGSLEGGRPGYFYANTYDLPSRPRWEIKPLTLHEAVPGHHHQMALAAEMEDVPEFRKQASCMGYIEGWGLYAESLGEELGLYDDPYSKFGQLCYEMWRAVRLVLDTGIHTMGWERQRCIDYLKANTGKADHDVEVEVDRYISLPGQALCYKTGELVFKKLRAHALEALKADFDLRAFHDFVLGEGALPLDLLESRTTAWIEDHRQSAKDTKIRQASSPQRH